MDRWSFFLGILQYAGPILIAAITIIPTIISNGKKTVDKIDELKKELKAEIKTTNDDVDTVKKALASHISDGEEEKAKQARQRILRFFDEICAGQEHSESHFEDILDDIDFYETYCNEHPKFKNSRGATAMEQIRDTYKHLKATGGFLTYRGGKHSQKDPQSA